MFSQIAVYLHQRITLSCMSLYTQHNQWKRKLAAIKRRNKQQDSNYIFSRFIEINVPFEVNVMYDQQTLKFVDSENNQPLRPTPENIDLRY